MIISNKRRIRVILLDFEYILMVYLRKESAYNSFERQRFEEVAELNSMGVTCFLELNTSEY